MGGPRAAARRTEGLPIPHHDDATPNDRDGPDPVSVCARVEEHEDRPDECTLFPASVSNRTELMTTWMTAEEGAFVDRARMR